MILVKNSPQRYLRKTFENDRIEAKTLRAEPMKNIDAVTFDSKAFSSFKIF